MKNIFLFLATSLFFFACKKDSVSYSQFEGVWEFENAVGYPFNNNYAPPGNGRIIVLSADGQFKRRQHDTVSYTGRYFLKKQKDCQGDEKKIYFTTDETSYDSGKYIDIDGQGRLTLSSSNCLADGGTVFYRRIN
jgi:hypothetical protein